MKRIMLGRMDESGALRATGRAAAISSSHQTTRGARAYFDPGSPPGGRRLYFGQDASDGTVGEIAAEPPEVVEDESGIIPLVIMAAKAGVNIAKKNQDPEKKAARKAKRAARRAERERKRAEAAKPLTLWERIMSVFGGGRKVEEKKDLESQVRGKLAKIKIGGKPLLASAGLLPGDFVNGLECVGQDELGAILVDTDGRRVLTD